VIHGFSRCARCEALMRPPLASSNEDEVTGGACLVGGPRSFVQGLPHSNSFQAQPRYNDSNICRIHPFLFVCWPRALSALSSLSKAMTALLRPGPGTRRRWHAGSCSSSVRGGKALLGTADALCDSGAATQWSWGVPGWA